MGRRMKLIPPFLRAATQNLRMELVDSPMESRFTAARTHPLKSALVVPTVRKPKDHPMTQLFTRSPLSSQASLTSGEVDCLDIVFGDAAVQRAAGRLKFARSRLREKTEYRSVISEALAIVIYDGGSSATVSDDTATSVVSVLNRLVEEVDEESEAATKDHEAHDNRHRVRMQRLAPLRRAVSAKASELINERNHLAQNIDAIKRSVSFAGESGSARYANLIAAGLTKEQISTLEASNNDPDVQIQTIRDRVDVIANTLLPPLEQFLADGLFDMARVAGLGFDVLINTRSEAEKAPA